MMITWGLFTVKDWRGGWGGKIGPKFIFKRILFSALKIIAYKKVTLLSNKFFQMFLSCRMILFKFQYPGKHFLRLFNLVKGFVKDSQIIIYLRIGRIDMTFSCCNSPYQGSRVCVGGLCPPRSRPDRLVTPKR